MKREQAGRGRSGRNAQDSAGSGRLQNGGRSGKAERSLDGVRDATGEQGQRGASSPNGERSLAGERSRKAGLPPGTPVHIGKRLREQVDISLVAYDADSYDRYDALAVDDLFGRLKHLDDDGPVVWLTVCGLHDVRVLQRIGDRFGIHDLVLEDIANTEQRAKLDLYEEYVFLVNRMPVCREEGRVRSTQVSAVLGRRFLLVFLEDEPDVFRDVHERLRTGDRRLRGAGPDSLFHAVLDEMVDQLFTTLETVGNQVELVEERALSITGQETLLRINRLRHGTILLRRITWQLRDVAMALERHDSPLLSDALNPYFRDVSDHVMQAMDNVDTFREILSGTLDIHLSANGNRMNAVMKVLTVISTIFMPLTFIVGVYGMNFEHMPELQWRYGYAAVWALIVVTALFMVRWFKRKKWF